METYSLKQRLNYNVILWITVQLNTKIKIRNFFLNQSYISMRGGQRSLNTILDNIYPIGSIYLSIYNTNPSEYFGGTWEQVAGGKYLFGVGGTDGNVTPGSTGGAWSHTHSLDTNTAIAVIQLNNKGTIWYRERNTGINNTKNYTYTASATGKPQENSSPYGAKLLGDTSSVQVIPPYYAVYMRKRIN